VRPLVRQLVTAVAAAALLATGCASPPDPLAQLVQAIPASLAADGLVLRRGGAHADLLASQLGLDPADVQASAAVGVPATRFLMVDGREAGATLVGAGFERVEAPAAWLRLDRPDDVAGFAGIPAAAVGEQVVAVGDPAALDLLVGGGRPLPVPPGALEEASFAVVDDDVGGSAGLALPAAEAAVAAVGEDGDGVVAVRLREADGQDEAVELSVALRGAGLAPGGGRVVEVGRALTREEVVTVQVTWSHPELLVPAHRPLPGVLGAILAS
jgi:hypothetical protein